jgi:hypothetical protein
MPVCLVVPAFKARFGKVAGFVLLEPMLSCHCHGSEVEGRIIWQLYLTPPTLTSVKQFEAMWVAKYVRT